MSTTETPTATSAIPYLCSDNAAAALDWYVLAFGAVETSRWVGDDGRIGHAEFVVGTSHFFLSDEYPEIGVVSPRTLGGTTFAVHLPMKDVDYSYARAVSYGATDLRPPADQPYGERAATLLDPSGIRWTLTQPLDTVAPAQLQADNPSYAITTRRPVEVGYLTMPMNDVGRAIAFYGGLLDWQVDPSGHIGNTKLPMGFHPGSPAPRLWFRVDDLEPYVAKVLELGGRVVERTESPSGNSAECEDDQGLRFDLWRPAPGY